jgi:hypothetical protein
MYKPGNRNFSGKFEGKNAVVVCSKSHVPLRFITTLDGVAKELFPIKRNNQQAISNSCFNMAFDSLFKKVINLHGFISHGKSKTQHRHIIKLTTCLW